MFDISTWNTADRINAALLVVAVVGILLTWWQARAGAKTQRAAFLRDLYGTINSDEGIREAFYSIEYGKFTYDADFHGSKEECNVDRLLSFVDLICELHRRRVLTRREMLFFEYRFRRVAADPHVQEYLTFLKGFYAMNDTRTEPFASFMSYSRQLARPSVVERLSRRIQALFPSARRKVVAGPAA
jgi:hypothetical protein